MILQGRVNLENEVEVELPASKSISNRVLIASKLAGMSLNNISGLSESEDSRQLLKGLNSDDCTELFITEGAVPLRFLLVYRAAVQLPCLIHCGDRLFQRPLQPLIDTLSKLGAEIELGANVVILKKGIDRFENLEIDTAQSSQFVSALMLVAPLFSGEKRIRLKGAVASKSYLKMTAAVMHEFGIEIKIENNQIIVPNGCYRAASVQIEKDWSSAAFIYSLVAIFNGPITKIKGLSKESIQGDSMVQEIYKYLGVQTEFRTDGIVLRPGKVLNEIKLFDFYDCPDLAPPVIATCSALGLGLSLGCKLKGLENLRYKESDRLLAMQKNLDLLGIELTAKQSHWELHFLGNREKGTIEIQDFNDHRIAMAFSVFSRWGNIKMGNPNCVNKSFPDFWKECKPWLEVGA